MICNKLGVWNAVGIGQDEIIPKGSGEGSIQNNIFSKSKVFVPEMADGTREGGGEAG